MLGPETLGPDKPEPPSLPHFVTFYSFKGGVGRTLALVNTALLLARHGRRTLVIDADLEAPGLAKVDPFHNIDPAHPGFLDLLEDLLWNVTLEDGSRWLDLSDERQMKKVELARYYQELDLPDDFSEEGSATLCCMPAGSQTENYPDRVEALRIGELYREGIGLDLFSGLRQAIAAEPFDYIMVDSRTGWSDMGGMCTRDLADTVAVVCGLNCQNISGTQEVMNNLKQARHRDHAPEILLIASPVPSYVEDQTQKRLSAFQEKLGAKPHLQLPYHPRLALYDEACVGAIHGRGGRAEKPLPPPSSTCVIQGQRRLRDLGGPDDIFP